MNIKIKKHVDSMFSEVPYSKKAEELKEEIMADMEAAYNDNISNGDSETEAFRKACDSLGNMDEVIENLMYPTSVGEFIGNIGDRLVFDLTVVETHNVENFYGKTTIHHFQDEKGNLKVG